MSYCLHFIILFLVAHVILHEQPPATMNVSIDLGVVVKLRPSVTSHQGGILDTFHELNKQCNVRQTFKSTPSHVTCMTAQSCSKFHNQLPKDSKEVMRLSLQSIS